MSNNDNTTSAKTIQTTSTVSFLICLMTFVLKGITAFIGKNSIQYIDVGRSFIETTAVFLWWLYSIKKSKGFGEVDGVKFNFYVSICMIISAVLISVFATMRFFNDVHGNSNVLLGILVSLLGMINNSIISLRYRKSGDSSREVITQMRLFAIKSASDGLVAISLILIMVMPGESFVEILELIFAIIIALNMINVGINNIRVGNK